MLDVTYSGTWSVGEAPNAHQVTLELTIGGPTVWLTAPVDYHGNVDTDATESHWHWGDDKGSALPSGFYSEAIAWLWALVAA